MPVNLFHDHLCAQVPQCRSQDPIPDDEVKFLQVGRRPVLQHAVAMEAILTIIEALGDLRSISL